MTVEEIAASFFSLLESILRAEGLTSTSMVHTRVRVSHVFYKRDDSARYTFKHDHFDLSAGGEGSDVAVVSS